MAETVEQSQPQVPDQLYFPGISYKNPKVVRPATRVANKPWFYQDQLPGPLSVSNKLKRWDKTDNLTRYKAIWNRSAKMRASQKLGAYFHDVPQLTELGLGAAPATSETTTTARNPLGFLENLVKTGSAITSSVADALVNREQQKQQSLQAQIQTYIPVPAFVRSGSNMTWILLGAGVLGIGAFLYFRK